MILSDRRFLGLMGWGCALFLLLVAGWVGVCLVNRPPYLMPDTTSFDTGDIFFSVGDSWESVAVRALSGTSSWEVTDSTPSHCGIVVRDARGVRLAHASTAAGKIVVETPEEYLRNNGSYCIYAVKPPMPREYRGHQADGRLARGTWREVRFRLRPHHPRRPLLHRDGRNGLRSQLLPRLLKPPPAELHLSQRPAAADREFEVGPI